jgi:nucleoside-diphosphate-sugar epimerase
MLKVTGANGFIGNAVLRYCRTHQIAVTGYSRSASCAADVVQVKDYCDIPASGSLIHLAECRTVGAITDEIIQNQFNLVQNLVAKNFNQLVYVSSAAVYQSSPEIIRTDSTKYNNSLYSLGKLQCEQHVLKARNGCE